MTNISISNLKTNPAKAIKSAEDFPVSVQKRGKVAAYLVGKELFEKLVSHLEDSADRQAVEETDFKKGRDFEKVADELAV